MSYFYLLYNSEISDNQSKGVGEKYINVGSFASANDNKL